MAETVVDSGGSKHPLAEVFGYPTRNLKPEAKQHRKDTLCPFNNKVKTCTKDKLSAPLGVCSIFYNDTQTIICPVRFREDWKICADAASFLFPKAKHWSFVKEIRLKERSGKSAGNIDVVIISHDQAGKVLDFGAVEIQAVYISGNIRDAFEFYMKDPDTRGNFDWSKEKYYPRPDYLSSSRKRLVPQLGYKGKILRAWNKKVVVAIDSPFFATLPKLPKTPQKDAEICWMVYQLEGDKMDKFKLQLEEKHYSGFQDTLNTLDTPDIGDPASFVAHLEDKLAVELAQLNRAGFASYSDLLLNKKIEDRRNPEPTP